MMGMVTETEKNCFNMKDGLTPNQLEFGKNPTLPNLMGEKTLSTLEREVPERGSECFTKGWLTFNSSEA